MVTMELGPMLLMWLIGMTLIFGLGTSLKQIEGKEREHRLRSQYPTAFQYKYWNTMSPLERVESQHEWVKKEAEEREQWAAGQSARDRKKWALRIAMLVVVVVVLWMLIVTG